MRGNGENWEHLVLSGSTVWGTTTESEILCSRQFFGGSGQASWGLSLPDSGKVQFSTPVFFCICYFVSQAQAYVLHVKIFKIEVWLPPPRLKNFASQTETRSRSFRKGKPVAGVCFVVFGLGTSRAQSFISPASFTFSQ